MTTDILRELFQATLASSAAIAAMLLLRRPLRRAFGAEAAYRCWLLVPAAVLAVWLPAPTLVAQPSASATVSMLAIVTDLASVPDAGAIDRAPLLLVAWIVGALLCALAFAQPQRRFNRRIRRQPAQPFDLVDGDGPAVVGIWRARVVLPEDFHRRYDAREQRLIIAHEQAHVRRGDLRAQAAAAVLRCLFWFNPLFHLGALRFRFDQELACDAAVLAQFPGERRRYADAMLKTQLALFGLPFACHWQSSHPLKERITMLRHPLPGSARRSFGALLTLALFSGGGYAAWAAQPAQSPDGAKAAKPAAANATATSTATGAVRLQQVYDTDVLTPPAYPKNLKGIFGKLDIELLVGVDGRVKDVTILKAEPAGLFEQATLEAVRQWKVHPSLKNGKPVETRYRTEVQFLDHDPDAPAAKG